MRYRSENLPGFTSPPYQRSSSGNNRPAILTEAALPSGNRNCYFPALLRFRKNCCRQVPQQYIQQSAHSEETTGEEFLYSTPEALPPLESVVNRWSIGGQRRRTKRRIGLAGIGRSEDIVVKSEIISRYRCQRHHIKLPGAPGGNYMPLRLL